MKIRSITYFMNTGWPPDEAKIAAAGKFLAHAKSLYEAEGYTVQTTRLATTPFSQTLGLDMIGLTPRLAMRISKAIAEAGIDYASLGPAMPDVLESYDMIPDAIQAAENIFFSGEMGSLQKGISIEAVKACAQVIVKTAKITAGGFANLRFAALANVPAGSPFFPAAYHDNDAPAFALALEAADLAVSAFSSAETLEDGRKALIEQIETHGRQLAYLGSTFKYQYSIRFGGIDFSLAPFPETTQSLGTAFENVGVPRTGLHGSLASAALLTEAIDRADFTRAGFSGLMMPVLEDANLSRRAAEGTLSVKDLLLYSAVCGTGLDTIPLPGDATADQIAALLLDVAVLGVRLNKPLTARLMPIPGKKVGDPSNFDFGFFANSKVMALESEGLGGLLKNTESFMLQSRNK